MRDSARLQASRGPLPAALGAGHTPSPTPAGLKLPAATGIVCAAVAWPATAAAAAASCSMPPGVLVLAAVVFKRLLGADATSRSPAPLAASCSCSSGMPLSLCRARTALAYSKAKSLAWSNRTRMLQGDSPKASREKSRRVISDCSPTHQATPPTMICTLISVISKQCWQRRPP